MCKFSLATHTTERIVVQHCDEITILFGPQHDKSYCRLSTIFTFSPHTAAHTAKSGYPHCAVRRNAPNGQERHKWFCLERLDFGRMLMRRVANADDFDVRTAHPVNHRVVFVRNEFPGARSAPRSADTRRPTPSPSSEGLGWDGPPAPFLLVPTPSPFKGRVGVGMIFLGVRDAIHSPHPPFPSSRNVAHLSADLSTL